MGDYRFANSHISKATLQGSSAYIVEQWTATAGYRWAVASTNLIKPYDLVQVGLNGFTYAQGGDAIPNWVFGVLTSEMFDDLFNTEFLGALSTLATIETLDQRTGVWEVYQCVATLDFEPITTAGNLFLLSATLRFKRPALL